VCVHVAERDLREMEIEHFSHKHPLMLIEELETYLKKEEICSGWEKSVLGPAYNVAFVFSWLRHIYFCSSNHEEA
jgi:hypothetical protein